MPIKQGMLAAEMNNLPWHLQPVAIWPFTHAWAYAWTKVGEVRRAMPQGKGVPAHSLLNLQNSSHPDLTADHEAQCRNSSMHCKSHCSSWPWHNAHTNRRQVHLRQASTPSMWGLDNKPSDQTHVWQGTMSTDDPNNSDLHDSDPWRPIVLQALTTCRQHQPILHKPTKTQQNIVQTTQQDAPRAA
jgi:hypothetical protein